MAAAEAVLDRSYSPYSGFKVAACLEDEEGRTFVGVNVENVAYPQSTCAEESAIAAMVTGGGRRFRRIAIVGSGEAPCSPCGGCRQRLAEFAGPDTPVRFAGRSGHIDTTVGALLPHAFQF